MNKLKIEIDEEGEETGKNLLAKYYKQIIKLASRGENYFFNYMFKEYTRTGKNGRHIFIPGKAESKVLMVCHLDTVLSPRKGFHWNSGLDEHGRQIIKMPTVDDRLGLITMFLLKEEWGIDVDWLLTEGEETGKSTAKDWVNDGKEYGWCVEFDRAGSSDCGENDVVTYAYGSNDKTWNETLVKAGFKKPGHGSFTDISAIEFQKQTNVKAMNIAIGYQNGHSRKAWFVISEWVRAMKLFRDFYAEHKDVRYEHVPAASSWSYQRRDDPWQTSATTIYYPDQISKKYRQGDLVVMSAKDRPDNMAVIGMLDFVPRRDMWVVTDEYGLPVDIAAWVSDIDHGVSCPNCMNQINSEWEVLNGYYFCAFCAEMCSYHQPEVIQSLVDSTRITIDGQVATIEMIDEGWALVAFIESGEFVYMSPDDLTNVQEYEGNLAVGDVVMLLPTHVSQGTPRSEYLVVSKEKETVCIKRGGSEELYVVPASILTNVISKGDNAHV